ncbi:MAG: hypothetical protein GX940_07035 [Clostridiaceae bacterium]|jgi:hypothetical protein|nr:hypothetical protein [Clostridiaceae bacterium]
MKLGKLIRDRFIDRQGGFGLNELLGIAAALIIAGFIVIPSMQSFAKNLITSLGEWWENTIAKSIFPTSV